MAYSEFWIRLILEVEDVLNGSEAKAHGGTLEDPRNEEPDKQPLALFVRKRQFHRRAARKALLTTSASRFSGRRVSHSTSSVINGALVKM